MDDAAAALRPIEEAAAAIKRLRDYGSADELAAAIRTVGEAVERSLRLRLRGDRAAPDEHRLSALAEDLPLETVVQSLRDRDRISIETAGTVHALRQALARAREGEARPSDADVARDAVERLRADLSTDPAEAGPTTQSKVSRESAGSVDQDPGDSDDGAVPPERRGRWMAVLAAGLAALFLVALAWVLTSGTDADYEDAVAAFRAGRLDSAAVGFQNVLEDRPENVSAMLYLARIHRRQEQPARAAEVLRRAAGVDPGDPDVRRELGHLFMDLGQPATAAAQYERAWEQEPGEMRNWAGLIRALRATGDPRAEELLADAPPEVQAMLGPAARRPAAADSPQ